MECPLLFDVHTLTIKLSDLMRKGKRWPAKKVDLGLTKLINLCAGTSITGGVETPSQRSTLSSAVSTNIMSDAMDLMSALQVAVNTHIESLFALEARGYSVSVVSWNYDNSCISFCYKEQKKKTVVK